MANDREGLPRKNDLAFMTLGAVFIPYQIIRRMPLFYSLHTSSWELPVCTMPSLKQSLLRIRDVLTPRASENI